MQSAHHRACDGQGWENKPACHERGNLIARQSADTLVVREASGSELRLAKNKIQEMRRSNVSLMPEALERALSRDELRDLLAFLQALK